MQRSEIKRALEAGDVAAVGRALGSSPDEVEAALAEIVGRLDANAAARRVLAAVIKHGLPLRWRNTLTSGLPVVRAQDDLESFFHYVESGTASLVVGARELALTLPRRTRALWWAAAAERVLPIVEAYHKGNPWPRRAVEAVQRNDERAASAASFEIQAKLLTDEESHQGDPDAYDAAVAARNAANGMKWDRSSIPYVLRLAKDRAAEERWLFERLLDLLLKSADAISA